MALLFADSFDHYATADITKKWTTSTTGTNCTTTIGAFGRNGTNGLRLARTGSGTAGNLRTSRTFSATQTLICGFSYVTSAMPPLGEDRAISELRDGGTTQVDLRLLNNGTLRVTRNGTTLGTSTSSLSTGVTYYIEWKIKVDNTTGTVDVKVNETSFLALTNKDTQNTSNATVDNFAVCATHSSNSDVHNDDFDDAYACDTTGSVNNNFLGDVRIECIFPSGAGNTTQFTPSTGSNYACVDEAAPNDDTDYVETDTVGNKDTYTYGNLSGTTGTIMAVIPLLYCKKSDAGSRSIAPVIRHSGTDYDGTAQNPGTGYTYLSQIYETNPGTSAAWTASEINAAEFGAKVTA